MRRLFARPALRRLRRDDSAVTIVEFAMIAPVLLLLILGFFDLGYRSYATSVMQGALHDAARMATVGGFTMAQIDARVKTRLSNFATRSTVTTATRSYREFSDVSQEERVVSQTAPTNAYNAGDCFEDVNNNNLHDDLGGLDSTGGADDIVQYTVTVTYPRIFPMGRLLGWSNTQTISANTVLRNQPFAGRNPVRRITISPINGAVSSC